MNAQDLERLGSLLDLLATFSITDFDDRKAIRKAISDKIAEWPVEAECNHEWSYMGEGKYKCTNCRIMQYRERSDGR